ncbi:Ubiquitin-protein ligase [Mycena kentingensis (nom. inval.)]|nr:Ubiquitin-protein ligase [Mycena kentingensis (nom. inval.)]
MTTKYSKNGHYRRVFELKGHDGGVFALEVGVDSRYLASAGASGLKVWDLATGVEVKTPMWGAHRGACKVVKWIRPEDNSKDFLVCGTSKGILCGWELSGEGKNIRFVERFAVHLKGPTPLEITAWAFDAPSSRLAASTRAGLVALFRFRSERMDRTMLFPYMRVHLGEEGDKVVPISMAFGQMSGNERILDVFSLYGGDVLSVEDNNVVGEWSTGGLINIKSTADPMTRLLTLQELSELLSISTEDTFAGSFQVEPFVKELVKILGGTGKDAEEDGDGGDDGQDGPDEDAALAAALAMSGGYQGDDNLEAQVLTKLIGFSYIDLAEQTLSTMEKISEEFPTSIVRDNGLTALLNYLDFFSIAVQRTALQAAANCCRNISPEYSGQIKQVWPIIRNCLSYSDQRLVEFACLCVIRVIDAYHRSSIENLEALVDTELIRAVNQLLLPAGAPLVAANTPRITIALFEADIVDITYQILTGVLPPAGTAASEQGDAIGGQGLGGGLADMTVMDNLAHRPKDQVEETLSLISELMPPLPKDGVFDHKAYTEKALARLVKAKAKAERAAARQATQAMLAAALLIPAPAESSASAAASADDTASAETAVAEPDEATVAPSAPDRLDLLRSKPDVVGRFMELMVPILIDVYAASVTSSIRIKTLTALLKAVSFLDADGLKRVLTFVPVASFASSILSSKDHPTLVIGALQLVDLLLGKVPSSYKLAFRREGVFHEIDTISTRALVAIKPKEKEKDAKDKEASESPAPSDTPDIPPP